MQPQQLRLFGCEHRVATEVFTTHPEGYWSPYTVSICVLCGHANGYPDKKWLKTWPEYQQKRLEIFMRRYREGVAV